MLDQLRAPLYEALEKYIDRDPVRFHVPGHKGIYPYDVTELPGLDDLHQAENVILEAQKLAAEVFGADDTFFLVGGSTVGNLAMIMATCRPHDKILVQRNVHKSVINGLILAQANPVYLKPEIDPSTGLSLTVCLQELEQELARHPDAKAVFLSNPNYYGMGMELHPYAECCEKIGVPLLIDEAHGAHFGLGDQLPSRAIESGATAVVQSTHKMLSAMTMASMLHIKGSRIDRGRLRQILAMLQSSSPSYPLMASLDLARKQIVFDGTERIYQQLAFIHKFREEIKNLVIPWLLVIEKGNYDYLDPFKITLRSIAKEWSGYRVKSYLESNGIFPELADDYHVVMALSMETKVEDLHRTIQVLATLPQNGGEIMDERLKIQSYHFSQEVVLSPHEAFYRPTEIVPMEDAIGQISGEMIAPYPPGIPAVIPGERMDEGLFAYLNKMKKLGCTFHGIQDSTLTTMKIIKT